MGRHKGSKDGVRNFVDKICETCGKHYKVYQHLTNTTKYCSVKCRAIKQVGNKLSKKTRKRMSQSRMGHKNYNWKDGKFKNFSGYILVLSPAHPFHNHSNYVYEHRLVTEAQIGRYLTPEETVHHLNEIKDDNRPRNLMVFSSNSAHQRFHHNPNNVKPSEIIFDGRLL